SNGASELFGYIDVARSVERDPRRMVETRIHARSVAVNNIAASSEASQSRDYTCGRDFAHGMIVVIGNVDVPGAIHRGRVWVIKKGRLPRAIGADCCASEGGKIVRACVVSLAFRTQGNE